MSERYFWLVLLYVLSSWNNFCYGLFPRKPTNITFANNTDYTALFKYKVSDNTKGFKKGASSVPSDETASIATWSYGKSQGTVEVMVKIIPLNTHFTFSIKKGKESLLGAPLSLKGPEEAQFKSFDKISPGKKWKIADRDNRRVILTYKPYGATLALDLK